MLRKALLAATAAAAIIVGAAAQPADANAGVKIHLGFGHGLLAPHTGPGFNGHQGWRRKPVVCRWRVKTERVRYWNRHKQRWAWTIVRQPRRVCF